MTDLRSDPDSDSASNAGDNTRADPDRGSPPDTPRWVKVFGIIVLALVLLFLIVHLTGGGFRGHSPPASLTGLGVQTP